LPSGKARFNGGSKVTAQFKYFIELSDIIGIRCECKSPKCGATLLLPLDDMCEALVSCPKCKHGWTRFNGSTEEFEVKKYLAELEKLKEMMKHLGFTLTLEIKEQVISNEK
jgi:hypothetical protein